MGAAACLRVYRWATDGAPIGLPKGLLHPETTLSPRFWAISIWVRVKVKPSGDLIPVFDPQPFFQPDYVGSRQSRGMEKPERRLSGCSTSGCPGPPEIPRLSQRKRAVFLGRRPCGENGREVNKPGALQFLRVPSCELPGAQCQSSVILLIFICVSKKRCRALSACCAFPVLCRAALTCRVLKSERNACGMLHRAFDML